MPNFGVRTPTIRDRIAAQLRGVTVAQYISDEWVEEVKRSGDNFEMLDHPVKLSWWKCWLWPFLPELILGDDPLRFKDCSIGHCLKCGKCGCLRWQFGDSGTDY